MGKPVASDGFYFSEGSFSLKDGSLQSPSDTGQGLRQSYNADTVLETKNMTEVVSDNWSYAKRPRFSTHATLVISDFEQEMLLYKPGDEVKGNIFKLNGKDVHISVYPNGENDT